MPKVVLTIPAGEKDLVALRRANPKAEMVLCEKPDPFTVADMQVFVTFGFDLTAELVDRAANLRWIQLFRAAWTGCPWRTSW